MLNILVKDLNYIYENNKSNYFFKNGLYSLLISDLIGKPVVQLKAEKHQ